MTVTASLRRWLQGTAGAALVVLGLWGLAATLPGTVWAQQSGRRAGGHETMHEMMEAMHGQGTAARMHELEGAEEMMDRCAAMMAMMGEMDMSRMGQMMRDGGMMDGMMDGRGMGGMMGSR